MAFFFKLLTLYLTSLPLQAMHLVYRALEKDPLPSLLPPSLIPPSKRKKTPVFPGAVPVLPASPPPKDSLRSTPSHGSVNSLNSTGSLSPKHSIKQAQVWFFFFPSISVNWRGRGREGELLPCVSILKIWDFFEWRKWTENGRRACEF